MQIADAKKLANGLAIRCHRSWSDERLTMFAADLMASAIGALPFEVVANTLRRLVAEIDPDDVTLAKLIEAVKTRPVVPERVRLEGPVVTGESPTERGIRWAMRAGIPRPPRNAANRALLADMLVQLARQMNFVCEKCRKSLNDDDLLAYTQACMEAGSKGDDEPERLCIACTPVEEAADVPF